jgi:cell wall-associated NlpC family hydrolase
MRTSLRVRAALTTGLCALLAACSLVAPRPTEVPADATPPVGNMPQNIAPPLVSPASELPPPEQLEQGAAIAAAAAALIGSPYHFGGADEAGFDCSGLALFVHEQAGISIPRTAAEQQHAARQVPIAQILPGDVLFFHIRKRGIDHVGIYTGDGHFVHAPHAGVSVSSADLSGGYYARHIVSAGRFWEHDSAPR